MKQARDATLKLLNEAFGFFFPEDELQKAVRVSPDGQFGDIAVQL